MLVRATGESLIKGLIFKGVAGRRDSTPRLAAVGLSPSSPQVTGPRGEKLPESGSQDGCGGWGI